MLKLFDAILLTLVRVACTLFALWFLYQTLSVVFNPLGV